MKADIHPNYHEITVKMTDGSTFQTYSTYGEAGAVLVLDIDPNTHPAWTGAAGGYINEKVGKVAKFKSKFADLDLGKKKPGANAS